MSISLESRGGDMFSIIRLPCARLDDSSIYPKNAQRDAKKRIQELIKEADKATKEALRRKAEEEKKKK